MDDRRRRAKEKVVAAILAGEKKIMHVAREMGVSRQAVAKWVRRYRENGTLKVQGRGRDRSPVLSNAQKRQARSKVAALLKARGILPGTYIPRKRRPRLSTIQRILARVADRETVTEAFARRTAKELAIPFYCPPICGLREDLDYPDEDVSFELAWTPRRKRSRRSPRKSIDKESKRAGDGDDDSTNSGPVLKRPQAKKRRRGRPPKKNSKAAKQPDTAAADPFADDDEVLPEDQAAYEAWVKETREMMAKRQADGAEPSSIERAEVSLPFPASTARHGVRTGKHAKGGLPTRKQKKKRRNRRH